jgi:uncharacterized membrane protein
MPRITFAGHPLHPQLVEAPTGLIPMSLAMDVGYLATGKRSYADAAYYTMLGGYVGALAAAMAGTGDYFAIPSHTPTKRLANTHLVLNLAVVGLTSLNLLRRRGRSKIGTVEVGMSAFGNLLLLVSAWYGGQMVYGRGLRVDGRSEISDAPEWRLPGDQKVEEVLNRVSGNGHMPETAPYERAEAERSSF